MKPMPLVDRTGEHPADPALTSHGPAPVQGDGAEVHATLLKVLLAENETLRRELEELRTYRTLAYRDALTGLWNRRYFDERLEEEISRSRRKQTHAFSVLLVDVNDLKKINDLSGHGAGDELLRWVGHFLTRVLRTDDICCRVGGDEFAVILPDASPEQVGTVVTRLRLRLAQSNGRRKVPVGLSFGTASFPADGTTIETLLGTADAAMYRDKRRQKAERGESTPTPIDAPLARAG